MNRNIDAMLAHSAESGQLAIARSAETVQAGDVHFGGIMQEEAAELARQLEAEGITQASQLIAMSPEMILALARRRVNEMDSQISAIMSSITNASDVARTYTNAQLYLQSIQQAMTGKDELDPSEMVGTPPLSVGDVVKMLKGLGITVGSKEDGPVAKESIGTALDSIRTKLAEINSGNEVQMLNLQECTQQRGAIISLTTNLLNSWHEADKSVIGNLR